MSVRGAKLLTVVLAGCCGVLLLLALILQAGWGRGYRWLDPDADAALASSSVDREPFKLPQESAYAATDARPLFNEDRKPTPELPDESVAPPPPSVPLNVALTGIVLTPQLHLAMIQDKAKNSTISLKEGMPMPGDQGGWTLTEIKQRSAIFKESGGDEVEVELTTAVASQKPNQGGRPGKPGSNPPAANGAKPPATPGPAGQGSNPQAAEQLQHRIEERRRQMRDEAERLKNQQKSNNPPNH
jgi:general secretion pathway protein N